MHYRTPRIGFLSDAEAFLERIPSVQRLESPAFDTDALGGESPLTVVPAAP
jgi:hypothetical protein